MVRCEDEMKKKCMQSIYTVPGTYHSLSKWSVLWHQGLETGKVDGGDGEDGGSAGRRAETRTLRTTQPAYFSGHDGMEIDKKERDILRKVQ